MGLGSIPLRGRIGGTDVASACPTTPALSELSDEALALSAKRDADAFATLYDRYVDRIYQYLRYRTFAASDADDLTSEVFFRALRAIGRYAPSAPFYSWIYRIARNALIDHHRAKHHEVPLDEGIDRADGHTDRDPERSVIEGDRRERLARALSHLSGEQQDVIVLRFIDGRSPEECGEILGKRPAAVRDLQFRALRALRRHISAEELAA